MTLEVRSLAFGFPGRTIGRDVGFALAPGEILCVLGPNGGGKTTLFRTILGLLPAHGGDVLFGRRSVRDLGREEIARLAGYVPQGHSAYFAFTLREFVLMGRTARVGAFASPGVADRRIAERALESLGIAHLGDKPVTEVSGGERQLALVARALAQEPQTLVMDEPTASLDFGNQGKVMREIRALAKSGHGVLFTTHDPNHALRAADRAYLLRDGKSLADGPVGEVLTREWLEALYGAPVQRVSDASGTAFLPG